jgi:hypothetical protein
MRQDGTVSAVRRVRAQGHSLGDARLNGIATSSDHTRIWVSVVGQLPGDRERRDGVVELPVF